MLRSIRKIICVFMLIFLILPGSIAKGHTDRKISMTDKPPEEIQGGEWVDHFWNWDLQDATNVDVQASHLFLKYSEQFHWTQTWTAHFLSGEFFQTESYFDAVRLAWDESSQTFFTSGVYTSTVFYAGRPVDWASSEWGYSGIPQGVTIEFRTGNTPAPDGSWTNWMIPERGNFEFMCAYTVDKTDCISNMSGINSSPYIQYRATFESNNPSKTLELYDIDLVYGIHCLSGSARSILIPPIDLRGWNSVVITSTIPANTTLVIDLLDSSGSVILSGVTNGTDLQGIDPNIYPTVQLRASLNTTDESISPDVDLWGLTWFVWERTFLPVLVR